MLLLIELAKIYQVFELPYMGSVEKKKLTFNDDLGSDDDSLDGELTCSPAAPPTIVVRTPTKEAGNEGENEVQSYLSRQGVEISDYWTELQQKAHPGGAGKTPDFLLTKPLRCNGQDVYWIDSKVGWLWPELQAYETELLLRQVLAYRVLYGPGLVLWSHGYMPGLRALSPEGVLHASRHVPWPSHLLEADDGEVRRPSVVTLEKLKSHGVEVSSRGQLTWNGTPQKKYETCLLKFSRKILDVSRSGRRSDTNGGAGGGKGRGRGRGCEEQGRGGRRGGRGRGR